MAHDMADLAAAQIVDGQDLRIIARRNAVEAGGVISEENPARLIGVGNELRLGGQFPFSQAVEISPFLRDTERVGELVGNDATRPGKIGGARAGIKVARERWKR